MSRNHRKPKLERPFFARPARPVAVELLGKRLVRTVDGRRLSGIIVETEAYCDAAEPDLACHGDRANGGQPTPRTAVMFGPAGFAYVYFTYGMHWMFNVVTGETGQANAVLIRALEPVEGEDLMAEHRNGRPHSELTNGPAKLAQALAIDKTLNGANLCASDGVMSDGLTPIWIEDAPPLPSGAVAVGPRIGLGKTPEPWLSMPWRYWVRDNAFVSK
ncbi:MAG: DNA-3-methyladenine glycosylase [Chloroflexi bacterium]|nr:DNA-3-methyladenine glycosylase [Chloroflexota bacterium]